LTSFRILAASDLHGSNGTFRRFVDLAIHEAPNVCVVSGDWSGKKTRFYRIRSNEDREYLLRHHRWERVPASEIRAYETRLKDSGTYLLEYVDNETAGDTAARESSARALRLSQWLDYASSKLGRLQVPLLTITGNDDDDGLDNTLSMNLGAVNLGDGPRNYGGYEFFGLGYSNPTPWKTPREKSEEEIKELLLKSAKSIESAPSAIGVIHVPPIASGLDEAPKVEVIGDRMRRVGDTTGPVGSSAVREFIEEFQPLMVFSGHCHTSPGVSKIGSCYCFNPGSLYHRGVLCAFVVRISGGEIEGYQRFVH